MYQIKIKQILCYQPLIHQLKRATVLWEHLLNQCLKSIKQSQDDNPLFLITYRDSCNQQPLIELKTIQETPINDIIIITVQTAAQLRGSRSTEEFNLTTIKFQNSFLVVKKSPKPLTILSDNIRKDHLSPQNHLLFRLLHLTKK